MVELDEDPKVAAVEQRSVMVEVTCGGIRLPHGVFSRGQRTAVTRAFLDDNVELRTKLSVVSETDEANGSAADTEGTAEAGDDDATEEQPIQRVRRGSRRRK